MYLVNNLVDDFEKCKDYTLRQYNYNKKIKKHKKDKDKIINCKSIKELLKLRKKLGLLDWRNL